MPFSGQAWGSGFPYPIPSVNVTGTQAEVAAWKGKPYFAYIALDDEFIPLPSDIQAAWDSFRRRTLSGAYLNFTGGDSDAVTTAVPSYSLLSPVYQASIIARVEASVDSGIMIDNIADPLNSIIYANAAQGRSFDSVTMAAFATYLHDKYSGSQLQSQFGLTIRHELDSERLQRKFVAVGVGGN